jgi:hypothetical protein
MTEDDNTTTEQEPGPDGRFDADYVTKLRGEAAERRTRAKAAEEALQAATGRLEALSGRLLALEVGEAARGILADPSDLLAHVPAEELTGEGGDPDPARIKSAAAALVERKAHLAPRPIVSGDVDQGARPPGPEPFDFAEALRRAAT